MLVHRLVEETVSRYPGVAYLASERGVYTYREFFEASNSIADFLTSSIKLERGDRVVVSLGNRPEAFQLMLGVMAAGGIVVPLAPTLPSNKLKYILDNCKPRVFCGAKSLKIFFETAATESIKHVISIDESRNETRFVHRFKDIVSQSGGTAQRTAVIDLDPAMIIYTSGSTGTPKGIVCSHLNIVSATRSIVSYLGITHEDRILNFQPFFFDYGLYQAFLAAFAGASLYLERNFMYPLETLRQIDKHGISIVPFVPTNIVSLFSINVPRTNACHSVRLITNTGAPFPVHLIAPLRSLFPNAALFSMYGLTECKRVSYLPPHYIDMKPTSVGIPMPNTEVWLVNERDEKIEADSVGELVVRGSNVTLGYWSDPEASSKTFRVQPNGERWLYTGDYFKQDRDGYLYFFGRKDDLLKIGGYRTSVKEIESTCAQLNFVQEVAAIPIADNQLGTSTKIFVVLKPGVSLREAEIRQHFRSAFESSTLVPRAIEIISALPRTPSGKVDYKSLGE